jgi:hypothetical protein
MTQTSTRKALRLAAVLAVVAITMPAAAQQAGNDWRLPSDDEIRGLIAARNAPRPGQGIVIGILGPEGERIIAGGTGAGARFNSTCTPQKLTLRSVQADSDDGGRRDGCGQRRDERRVRGVRSESFVVLGHAEGQDPTRNVVVHGCSGKSSPQAPIEDAVRSAESSNRGTRVVPSR